MSNFKIPSSIPQNLSIESLQSKAICTTSIAGENIPKGAVLKQSSTVDMRLVQTTSADDNKILGVAAEKSYSGRPMCVVNGGEFQVLVTGAVTRGDFLSSSSTTGTAYSTGTSGQVGDFAISLVSDATTTPRLICARYKKSEVY